MAQGFITNWLFLLLGLTGLAIRSPVANDKAYSITLIGIVAVICVLASAAFVTLIGLVDAWLKINKIARDAGSPLDRYVVSEEYERRGREKLRRNEKQRKWL